MTTYASDTLCVTFRCGLSEHRLSVIAGNCSQTPLMGGNAFNLVFPANE